MSSTSVDVFRLGGSTPTGLPFHGAYAASLTARASASFHRGFSLAAGFDLDAHVSAEVRDAVSASIEGGVGARGGLALEAALPLDLFDEAGLVARLQAQLAVDAYVKTRLALELDVFSRLVRGRLGEGPGTDLLDIFFDEVRVEAGFWGRAAFAAEVLGEATLTGSLLPNARHGAGFTFALGGSGGIGFGAGCEFQTNLGFEDPRRLVSRVTDRVTELALAEAERFVAELPPAQRLPAEQALPPLRTLLPLALRSAYEVGVALATIGQNDDAAQTAKNAIVNGFLREAQDLLLRALQDFAADELGRVFRGIELVDRFMALDDETRQRVLDEIGRLAGALAALEELRTPSVGAWLDAILDVVDPLASLLTVDLIPGNDAPHFRRGLGLFYASTALAHRVATWAELPQDQQDQLFGDTPVPAPNPALAQMIADEIGKPAGMPLTLLDLVEFVLGTDPLAELRVAAPGLAASFDWLEELLGLGPDGDILRELLVALAPPSPAAVARLLEKLAAGIAAMVEDQIVDQLIEPLKKSAPGDETLVVFLDTVVTPALIALPRVTLARLPDLATETGVRRMREGVSAVIMQSMGLFVVQTIDVLLERALADGERSLREVADAINRNGRDEPGYGEIATNAARSDLPINPEPDEAAELVLVLADGVALWNGRHREPLLDALRAVITLDLESEESRDRAFATLATTDEPVNRGELELVLGEVRDGALELLGFVVPRALEILGEWFLEEAEKFAQAALRVAREVVQAFLEGLEWLAGQVDALRLKLEELLREARAIAARITADLRALSDHLIGLVGDGVERLRALGWSIIEPLVPDWLPDWLRDGIRGVYDGLFDAIRWLLEAPLQVLGAVAAWLHEILVEDVERGSLDEANVRQRVSERVYNWSAFDIHFDMRFGTPLGEVNFGRITLPTGDALSAIAGVVTDDLRFGNTVDGSVVDSVALRSVKAQQLATERALEGALDPERARAEVDALFPLGSLSVDLSEPVAQRKYDGRAPVRIRIARANRTFVENSLGVPRRIRIRVNGVDFAYQADQWREDGDGLSFTGEVVADTVTSAGASALPPTRPVRVAPVTIFELPQGERLVAPPTGAAVGAAPDWGGLTVLDARVSVSGADVRGVRAAATGASPPSIPTGQVPVDALVAAADRGARATEPVARRASGDAALDLLPSVPGRPGLNVVQVSVANGAEDGDTARAAVLFFLSGGAAPRSDVAIVHIESNPPGHDVPSGERVVIRSGVGEPIDMSGWKLRDLRRHIFTFPEGFVLSSGADVTVWTRAGTADATNLYWNRRAAVWNNVGDSAILHDAEGNEVARTHYEP